MKNLKLKSARAAKDYSQQQLADLVGVSRQTINAIETGRFDPSLPLALRLALTFGRPVEDVFTLRTSPARRGVGPAHGGPA